MWCLTTICSRLNRRMLALRFSEVCRGKGGSRVCAKRYVVPAHFMAGIAGTIAID